MPQLSPLNWIFLFLLAWSSIFLVFAMLWWGSKVEYFAEKPLVSEKGSIKSKMTSWRW